MTYREVSRTGESLRLLTHIVSEKRNERTGVGKAIKNQKEEFRYDAGKNDALTYRRSGAGQHTSEERGEHPNLTLWGSIFLMRKGGAPGGEATEKRGGRGLRSTPESGGPGNEKVCARGTELARRKREGAQF